jgi:hypothetical protein
MFAPRLFHLIRRLIFSRWVRECEEHLGPCEDTSAARLGPLHLEVNQCFVLDHDDAFISVRIPTPLGRLWLGYRVCLGEEQIRRPGFHYHRQVSR